MYHGFLNAIIYRQEDSELKTKVVSKSLSRHCGHKLENLKNASPSFCRSTKTEKALGLILISRDFFICICTSLVVLLNYVPLCRSSCLQVFCKIIVLKSAGESPIKRPWWSPTIQWPSVLVKRSSMIIMPMLVITLSCLLCTRHHVRLRKSLVMMSNHHW